MIEVFANHFSSHLGRHLFYWAISQTDITHFNLRLRELINKFHAPLERGMQILDHLLTLEEDDFNGHWGNAYTTHNYVSADEDIGDNNKNNNYSHDDDDDDAFENQEKPQPTNNYERLRNMEAFNNGNGNSGGILLSLPHNNSAQPQQRATAASGAVVPAAGAAGNAAVANEDNMQITQSVSPPSTPMSSPEAPANNTATSCVPSSSSSTAAIGSGSYVCSSAAAANSHAPSGDGTADPNWQASKATVLERNAAMFNNDLMSDVKFVVGGDFEIAQIIPAHKYILATGSSVFYAMFYGGLAEPKQEIKVPDVEPSAFLTLLRYLYCDEIQLEPDNILATLYVAKKYIVPHLARACVNYLEVKLTAKNACLLLSQSRLFEEPELMQRCWEVIDAQAEMAIKSEGFVDIDLKTFESILSREMLNCKEIHLFEAALNWALNACQKMAIEPTAQNKRKALGAALYAIRIPTMSLEEFANGVAQTGILTSQETIDIFLNFTATKKPILNFLKRPRMGLKTQVCHRFQSCAYRSNQWRYRGRCDSIQFSVDHRIFIVGFGLYGSSTGAANYGVKIELKRLGRTLGENETKFFSDGSSNTFHVFFENPIQIEPECYYTASVILDGNELSFFGQEGMTEVCMGNVTFQFQCSSESTNGTGVQGGQIPELIFYGPSPLMATPSSSINSIYSPGSGGAGALPNFDDGIKGRTTSA